MERTGAETEKRRDHERGIRPLAVLLPRFRPSPGHGEGSAEEFNRITKEGTYDV